MLRLSIGSLNLFGKAQIQIHIKARESLNSKMLQVNKSPSYEVIHPLETSQEVKGEEKKGLSSRLTTSPL